MNETGEIIKYRVADPEGSVTIRLLDEPLQIRNWRGELCAREATGRDVHMTVTLSGLVIPTPPR